MEINYTYTVVSVYEQPKNMAVLYSCSGCDDITIEMSFPVSGTSLEDHVQSYAPLEYWALNFGEANLPSVGATGLLSANNKEGELMFEYTYEVLSIDSSDKSMLVVYKTSGLDDITVGVRTPFADETLEDVIRMYAPIPNWEEASKEYVTPAVGATGSLTADVNIYKNTDVEEAAPTIEENMFVIDPLKL